MSSAEDLTEEKEEYNTSKSNHETRQSVDLTNIVENSFMTHKRKQSQMEQLEKQYGALYGEETAKQMAVETMQRMETEPYNLFSSDQQMQKVLEKIHKDEIERETHLETAYENDELNMDDTISKAYLNHKKKQSTFLSLKNDFALLYPENEAKQYAIEVMDQMDRDPTSLFEDDSLMQKVLDKKYLDEIVEDKTRAVSEQKLKENKNPTEFNDEDVKKISRSVVKDVFSHQSLTNPTSNVVTNIQDEELNILLAEKDDIIHKLKQTNETISQLKEQVVYLIESKYELAKNLSQSMNLMRKYLCQYNKNVNQNKK